MLFTYTPNEQTKVNADIIKKHLEPSLVCRQSLMNLHQVGNTIDFSFTTSWCRELTTGNLFDWVGELPPGQLNIYGIRKHGNVWGSQPHGIPGRIDIPNRKINTLFYNLFQFMTEMISYVFETNTMGSHSTETWLYNLGTNLSNRVSSTRDMSCLLNNNPNSIPTTPLWTTDEMYGTMFNIPSKWTESPAVMSYLLYLLRIWGAFYDSDMTLTKLVRLGKLKYNTTKIAALCGCNINQDKDDSMQLWRHIARSLMIPLWFTHYGREDFWTFTYLLIKEGIAVKEGLARIAGLQETLKSGGYSGFSSWLRGYRVHNKMNAPDWVRDLHGTLYDNGPLLLLTPKFLIEYV